MVTDCDNKKNEEKRDYHDKKVEQLGFSPAHSNPSFKNLRLQIIQMTLYNREKKNEPNRYNNHRDFLLKCEFWTQQEEAIN